MARGARESPRSTLRFLTDLENKCSLFSGSDLLKLG